jgi:NRPS condensation-like uncharacterized protein
MAEARSPCDQLRNPAVNAGTPEPSDEPGSLFPLPLSDFEYYMLADDRPSHPMVFTLIAHLSGTLARTHLTAAVNTALSSHPLLNCRIQKLPGRGWCWVTVSSEAPRIDWVQRDAETMLENPPISHIDLRHESGLRIFVATAPDRAQVVFHIHHSCCDGAGAIEFLGEVFARYGLATLAENEDAPTVGTIKVSLLARRGDFSITQAEGTRPRRSLSRILGKAGRLILRRPIPILARQPVIQRHPSSVGNSSMITQVLPKEITRRLREVAQQLSASVNDLCILEMLRLIRTWNRAAGDASSNRWIRLVIPVSLRTADHDHVPAANLVSYAFVTRTSAECDDPATLLQSIRKQTGEMLHQQEGLVFLKCVRFLRRIPGLLSLLLQTKSCFGSIVLAYVGDVRRLFSGRLPQRHGKWVAGNITIERIDGVAPLRPNTRAAMSIGTYAGEMIVNLRTDRAALSHQDAADFLAEFAARLTQLALTGRLADDAEWSSVKSAS